MLQRIDEAARKPRTIFRQGTENATRRQHAGGHRQNLSAADRIILFGGEVEGGKANPTLRPDKGKARRSAGRSAGRPFSQMAAQKAAPAHKTEGLKPLSALSMTRVWELSTRSRSPHILLWAMGGKVRDVVLKPVGEATDCSDCVRQTALVVKARCSQKTR